jgi:hypothetical protein
MHIKTGSQNKAHIVIQLTGEAMRNFARELTVSLTLLLSCFWSPAHAELFSPATDCGGREAIDLVIEIAAKHDYGMMGHNAASKYFEMHPTQEFIDAKNYVVKAEAAYPLAAQATVNAEAEAKAAGVSCGNWCTDLRTGTTDFTGNPIFSGPSTRMPAGAKEKGARVMAARQAKAKAAQEVNIAVNAVTTASRDGIAAYQAQAKPPLTYTVETIRTLAKDETGRQYCEATLRGNAGEFGEWTALMRYTVEATSDHRLYITIQR